MAWKQNNYATNNNCKKLAMINIINSLAYSPNTNGSHIEKSTQVKITKIDTDNDYISLGDGSKEVIILNVTCGLEHSISFVEDLNVKNCTLRNTNNGLRIKTWPGTPINSLAFDLHFEDTKMINVINLIIIDQENFYHSRRSTLVCRSDVPFEIVDLNDIDIRFNGTTLATGKYANIKSNFGRKAPICAT
uniref:Polygalacturonase n=1 Tax=Glycine max TaxID=3847 RepID=A0A0R0GJS7_SOYBN